MILHLYSQQERLKFWRELLECYSVQAAASIHFRYTSAFEHDTPEWTINGNTQWRSGAFLIRVRAGLSSTQERETVAHELGHILEGHVARWETSQAVQAVQRRNYNAWTTGTAAAAVQKQYDVMERSANVRAQAILKEWTNAGIVP